MPSSMTNQIFQLQKETTPGTPLVAAMRRLMGITARPAVANSGGESFKASGYKATTAHMIGDLTGEWSVSGIQDFNALGYVLASLYGPPVTTTPTSGATPATNARQHVFTMTPAAAEPLVAYTAQWGDTTRAIQGNHFLFNSLELSIQRRELSFGSSAISRKPDKGATLATTGTAVVPSQPIPPRSYNVYSDNTWAGLGTTKLLAAYKVDINYGDKYGLDAPINSSVLGFESVVENDDIDLSGSLQVGFDATGAALWDTFENEAIKFIRVAVDGPIIEAAIPYSFKFDRANRLANVGEPTEAPDSQVVTLEFDTEAIVDPVSGNVDRITLVNAITSYV